MLRYKLLYIEGGEYFYEYYVEDDESNPGIIAKKEGERGRIVKLSDKDPNKYYAFHAFSGIDVKKSSGTVAWY